MRRRVTDSAGWQRDQARKDPDAAELVTWASDALLSQALRLCDFHDRGALPIQLAMRKGLPIPAATLRVQMVDNDAAYLHEGGVQLWA